MSSNHTQTEQTEIPLRNEDDHWRAIFEKYDADNDGRISYTELKTIIDSHEYENDIPDQVVVKIMQLADTDGSGYLDFHEFKKMMTHPQLQSVFGHLVYRYVNKMIPGRGGVRHTEDTVDGAYEEQYKCCPPPVFMIIISIVEVVLFLWDVISNGYYSVHGDVSNALIYNPYKRYEAWRYGTYMFVHIGAVHLVVNLLVQIMLGIPLEMVHKWWRVGIIYFAGVIAGSLGTSITDPYVFLAGASGGVYALITAHFATLIMNWGQMEFAWLQLIVFVVVALSDIGNAVYNRYFLNLDENIGYAAHLFGSLAGLLVGLCVLKNLEVRSWEKVLVWCAVAVYAVLMGSAIITNIAWTSHFPEARPNYR